MILESGEFKAGIDSDGDFAISIKQESDISIDGGHTHEDTTNTFYLSKVNAAHLISELQGYIDRPA